MSGFLGPWFCSLFFNTSSDCKKQTHLEAHTYPHLAEDALNKNMSTSKKEGNWVIILKVGPFEVWDDARSFIQLWAQRTRGKPFRIDRSVHLFEQYRDQYKLKMWVQRETRDEAMARFEKEKEQNSKTSAPPPSWKEDTSMLHEQCSFEVERLFTEDHLTMKHVEQWLINASRASKKRRTKKKLIKL